MSSIQPNIEREIAFDRYMLNVRALLLDFQYIEESLKILIAGSYEAIRRSAPAMIYFRPSRSSLEKDSLGKLIQKYESISRNDPLIRALRTVLADRNFCAHRSYLLSIEEQEDIKFLEAESQRMEVIRILTKDCLKVLSNELQVIAAHLNESSVNLAERDAPQAPTDEVDNLPPPCASSS